MKDKAYTHTHGHSHTHAWFTLSLVYILRLTEKINMHDNKPKLKMHLHQV